MNEDQEESDPRRLQVCSWLTRSVQNRQTRLHLWSGFDAIVLFLVLLCILSSRVRRRQTSWWWDTRINDSQLEWTISNGRCDRLLGFSFKQALNHIFSVHQSRWSVEDSSHSRWRFPILAMWILLSHVLDLFKYFNIGDEFTTVNVEEPFEESKVATIYLGLYRLIFVPFLRFLCFKVFGLLSSSLLLYSQCFGRYVLWPF